MSQRKTRRAVDSSIQPLESRIMLSAYVLSALASLDPNTGSSGLTQDSHGNLFGTTEFGGSDNNGQVFEIAAGTGAFSTVASFDVANGVQPYGGVVADSAGDLFGTADGPNNDGNYMVYEIPAGTSNIVDVAEIPFFTEPSAQPAIHAAAASGAVITNTGGGLIIDSQGNLYGIGPLPNSDDDGQVFEIPAGSNTPDMLAELNNGLEADTTGLVMDSQGNLYGTSAQDGANSDGYVFEVQNGSGTATDIADFDVTNGEDPGSNSTNTLNVLTVDSAGDLFGTTNMGGQFNDGTIFEIAAGSTTIQTLASFNNGSDPADAGGVILDSAGNLFGTTMAGGANNDGLVFELKAGKSTIKTLASFDSGADGLGPIAGPVMDANGNLYVEGRDAVVLVTKLTFATELFQGLLEVPGTAGADTISVSSSGDLVTATLNGRTDGPFVAGINGVESVSVSGGGGADMIDLSGVTSGTSLFDVVASGGGGADTIIGSAIGDNLSGGGGSDSISGGAGNDTISGGGGNDTLLGGAGDDSISSGAGNDSIRGNGGNDTLNGGSGDDILKGNGGNDSIVAGSGGGMLLAGAGSDVIVGSTTAGYAADSIFCGGSTDTITAGANDQIFDSVPGDQITGGKIIM